MSNSNREAIIDEQEARAFREAIRTIENFSLPFRNLKYDLKKTVDSDIDFILGAVISEIMNSTAEFLKSRGVDLTPEEIDKINLYVFSNAGMLKDGIRKILNPSSQQ
jgi:hypothetical protein